jgi:hypothetical protein
MKIELTNTPNIKDILFVRKRDDYYIISTNYDKETEVKLKANRRDVVTMLSLDARIKSYEIIGVDKTISFSQTMDIISSFKHIKYIRAGKRYYRVIHP